MIQFVFILFYLIGFSNFGSSGIGFRRDMNDVEDVDQEEQEMSHFRYASPYDTPKYVPKAPKPAYKAPPVYTPPAYNYPAPKPVQCPQNLLIGCAPRVQYVPCSAPPPSYGGY